MIQVKSMGQNLWRRNGKLRFPIDGLQFYAPLWHPGLNGATFKTKDLNSITGTVTNATWGITGRTFASATSDRIDCGTPASCNFTSGDFSGIAWIYPTAITIAHGLIARYTYQATGWGFVLDVNTNYLTFDTHQVGASQRTSTQNNSIAINTWYCVGFTRSGANVLLYINGADATSSAGSHTDPVNQSAISLKLANRTGGTNSLDGIMGDVWIYSRLLTATEMKSIYLNTLWRYR